MTSLVTRFEYIIDETGLKSSREYFDDEIPLEGSSDFDDFRNRVIQIIEAKNGPVSNITIIQKQEKTRNYEA